MSPRSGIYEGVVTHRRRSPLERTFSARLTTLYLDLDELPALFDGHPLWSARGPAPAWWRREDYLGPVERPLDVAVRDLVQARLGVRPLGPVRMLAQPRTWGIGFNPVVFYWCFDPAGDHVEAVVAEVTNTPWGERHAYVAGGGGADEEALASRHAKAMHVSPLMGMEQEYVWRIARPGERIAVSIASEQDGEVVFEAGLALRRREITRRSLTTTLLRRPLGPAQVLARIYVEALRSKLKGARWHAKPPAPRPSPAGVPAAPASSTSSTAPAAQAEALR